MQKYQNNLLSNKGTVLVGVSVTVLKYPAGTIATIYSDNGITVTANPIITDSNGNFAFYGADGHYSLQISGPGIVTTTILDILLVDVLPSDLSTTLPSTSGKLWNNGGTISVS